VTCPLCKGAKLIRSVLRVACPVCTVSALVPAKAVVDRVSQYHKRRAGLANAALDAYVVAHIQVATSILAGDYGAAVAKFADFFTALTDFLAMEIRFDDLIAPDLVSLETNLKRMIRSAVKELEKLQPDWIKEIKKELFEGAASTVAMWAKLKLTDTEKAHYLSIWSKYSSLDEFPPFLNGLNFFLHSLDGCTADMNGVAQAASKLGKANSIDKRCQPFAITDHLESTFPWDEFYKDFVDPAATNAYCGSIGFDTSH
jgi:hypothetical protein